LWRCHSNEEIGVAACSSALPPKILSVASPLLTTPLSEFHLFQTDQLQDLHLRMQSLVEQSESQEEMQREILSEMRSSGSSILALSMSHNARLRDIQSLCNKLSDRMDTVLSRLSSRSSRAPSQAGEIGDPIPRVLERTGEVYNDQRRHDAAIDHIEHGELNEESDGGNDFESSEYGDPEHAGRKDLMALFDICEDFQLIVRQYFDTIIADYVIKAQEWQALASRSQLLAFLDSDPRAPQMVFNGTLTDLASSCASKLLSLRRRAQAESLEESLLEADALFRFGPEQVEIWQELTHARLDFNEEKLPLPNETDSSIKAKEHLTRTNEWLLEELYSAPHLAELH
jgi:hypothetical protein